MSFNRYNTIHTITINKESKVYLLTTLLVKPSIQLDVTSRSNLYLQPFHFGTEPCSSFPVKHFVCIISSHFLGYVKRLKGHGHLCVCVFTELTRWWRLTETRWAWPLWATQGIINGLVSVTFWGMVPSPFSKIKQMYSGLANLQKAKMQNKIISSGAKRSKSLWE